MPACPNCGGIIEGASPKCPDCGEALSNREIWPPPPDEQVSAVAPPQWLLTRTVWGDVISGILTVIGLYMVCGTGIVTIPIMYFTYRRKYPVYADAMRGAYFASLVVLAAVFLFYLEYEREVANGM